MSDIRHRTASLIKLMTWDEDAVIAAARELRAGSGGADIAFAFVSSGFREHLKDFIEILQVEGHAKCVVGCSADGMIGTAEEDESVAGFSALFLNLPGAAVAAHVIREDFELPRTLSREGCWIVLGNPARLHAQLLLEDMNRLYPRMPVFGGMAGGGWDAESIFLFHSSEDAEEAAGIAVHLSGVNVRGLVSQGCQPIGEPLTITRAEENLIYAVGGRRAYDVLVETFEKLPEDEKNTARGGNIMAGIAATEYREEFGHGDFLIRNIMGGDPMSGAIKIGAIPRVGQTLQFQLREKDAASADLRAQCEETMRRHGPPAGILLFCCGGRGQNLFGIPNHDAGVLADTFGRVPVAGFFANGEFGPVAGVNFVHGYTASAALFY
jgi:small ligand-binding sensory domain FIST